MKCLLSVIAVLGTAILILFIPDKATSLFAAVCFGAILGAAAYCLK